MSSIQNYENLLQIQKNAELKLQPQSTVHGSHMIENSPLPIGQLSEEAQKARNNNFKRILENQTRKISSIATNEDELNYLLFSSDPVAFSYRKSMEKVEM
jgi:hypothetical protein